MKAKAPLLDATRRAASRPVSDAELREHVATAHARNESRMQDFKGRAFLPGKGGRSEP